MFRFTKRKPSDKIDRPPKKLKVVTGSTVEETPNSNKLPPPPRPGKGKGVMTSQGLVTESTLSSFVKTRGMQSSNSCPSLRMMITRTWAIMQLRPWGKSVF